METVAEFAAGNYETIAFFVLLGLGIFGWWGMIRWDRRNAWWMRAAAVLCFLGLTGAGRWMPDLMRVERERVEATAASRSGAEPGEAKPSRLLPSGAERLADDRKRAERYEAVLAEIGPPPTPDAVPVLGYETRAGVRYASYWRTVPDSDRANNFESE